MTMDQRELESSIKQLNKTVQANDPPSSALALLERLKKEAAPTEEMLRVRHHHTLKKKSPIRFFFASHIISR